jgi:hypothetical protein
VKGLGALIAVAGGLVLVLLIVLKGLLAEDSHAEPMATVKPVAATPTLRDQAPPPPTIVPGARAAKPVTVAKAAGSSSPQPTLSPVNESPAEAAFAGDPDDDPPTSNDPVANKPVLREAMESVEPQVRECISRFGSGVSGTVTATWNVVSKRGQSLIEAPGIDDEGTTVANQDKLVECLRDTAFQMHFASNPGGVPVVATRKITIEAGALVSQEMLHFRRIR